MRRLLIGLIFLLGHGLAGAATLDYTSQYRLVNAEVEVGTTFPSCRLANSSDVTSMSPGDICSDGGDSYSTGSFDASGSAGGSWEVWGLLPHSDYSGYVRANQSSSLGNSAINFSGSVRAQGVEGSPLHDAASTLLDVSFDLASTSFFQLSAELSEVLGCVSVEGSDYCSSPGDGYDALLVLEDLGTGTSIFSATNASEIDALNGTLLALDAGSYRLRVELGVDNMACYSGSFDTHGNCWWTQPFFSAYFGEGPSSVIYDTDLNFAMSTVVPVPPALVLFPSALAALGWVRWRREAE
jgi:hypothetical protein